MMFPTIRCYHEGSKLAPHSFYILCKGDNAGKPGFKPWVNSFALICNNKENFNFFFWLIYGLWQNGKFKNRHRGSVIPFINLQDVRDILRESAPLIHPDWSRYQEVVATLDKLNDLKTNLTQQLIATEKLQRSLFRKIFHNIK